MKSIYFKEESTTRNPIEIGIHSGISPSDAISIAGRRSEKFERLMDLWKEGKRDKRLIVISALDRVSKKDYENSKQVVLSILGDISDWEICDQLALRVIVNLVVQNQKETFSLMERWISSENKWIRRLAVATIPLYIRAKPIDSGIFWAF